MKLNSILLSFAFLAFISCNNQTDSSEQADKDSTVEAKPVATTSGDNPFHEKTDPADHRVGPAASETNRDRAASASLIDRLTALTSRERWNLLQQQNRPR